MLAPSAIILGVFYVYPLIRSVWLGRDRGWGQYIDVARSVEFQHALWVTSKFTLITVPLGVALGVALAMLADKHLRGIGLFRLIFSSTVATSVAVTSLVWLFLLQPNVGVLSNVDWIGNTFDVIKQPGLLNDRGTALWSVALSSVWGNLGFTFIIVTAGLQSIPRDLHEAATVDGAGNIRRFWSVTMPLLGPTLLFVVIVLTTRAFQSYGEIELLTGGGPGDETTTLTYFIYGDESIIRSVETLRATSLVLLFLAMLVLAVLQLFGAGRRVHYGQ